MPHRIYQLFAGTPAWDKGLALLGASSASLVSFTHLNTFLGVLVTFATLAMIVPRALMNWEERAEIRERRRRDREKLARLEEIHKGEDYDIGL